MPRSIVVLAVTEYTAYPNPAANANARPSASTSLPGAAAPAISMTPPPTVTIVPTNQPRPGRRPRVDPFERSGEERPAADRHDRGDGDARSVGAGEEQRRVQRHPHSPEHHQPSGSTRPTQTRPSAGGPTGTEPDERPQGRRADRRSWTAATPSGVELSGPSSCAVPDVPNNTAAASTAAMGREVLATAPGLPGGLLFARPQCGI